MENILANFINLNGREAIELFLKLNKREQTELLNACVEFSQFELYGLLCCQF